MYVSPSLSLEESAVGTAVFFSITLLVTIIVGGALFHKFKQMQKWIGIKAKITKLEVCKKADPATGKVPNVIFEYEFDYQGETYQGNRLNIYTSMLTNSRPSYHGLDDLVISYEKGEAIQVWVNPDNPSESVFDRSLNTGIITVCILCALGSIGILAWNLKYL